MLQHANDALSPVLLISHSLSPSLLLPSQPSFIRIPQRQFACFAGIECSLAARPLRICAFVTHQHNETTGQRKCPGYNNDYCKDKSRHLQQSCTNDKRVVWHKRLSSTQLSLVIPFKKLHSIVLHLVTLFMWGGEFPVSFCNGKCQSVFTQSVSESVSRAKAAKVFSTLAGSFN